MCLGTCCTGWRRISRCWSPWIPNLCRQDKFTFKYYFYSHFPLHVNFPLFSLILNFHYIRCVFSALLQGNKCKAFRHVHFSISTWFLRIFKKPEYFYLIKLSHFRVKRLQDKKSSSHQEKYIFPLEKCIFFVRKEIIFIIFSPKIIFVVRKVNSLCQKIKF